MSGTHRSHLLSLVWILALAVLLTACGGQSSDDTATDDTTAAATDTDDDAATQEANEDEEPETVIPVEVMPLHRGDVFAAYTSSGSLEAFEEATVVAKVGGEVLQIFVEEGDKVEAGQVLARLDGERLKLELEQSRANLAKLEQEHQRNVELHERGLVAANAFETIKYDLDALRAAFRLAELQYRYTAIRAPFTGVISSRDIKVGNTIQANEATFRLTALDPLVAYLFIPEREYGRISANQSVSLQIDAMPGDDFVGRVARISPTVDAESGTFKATIEVTDESGRLKPGMFGRFAVIYDTQANALLLPQDALIETTSSTSVFVVDEEGIARRVEIETGYTWKDEVAVLSGLEDGARVVVVGQMALTDGTKVRVIGSPESETSRLADATVTADSKG
ncbi:MAG: efflux RND transporter periplasmic adaptor subunit [Pseudomonadota bacterium]